MQSSGFANFMVKIIRKDWKQHGKMLLGLVGGMMLVMLVMTWLTSDLVFAKGVAIGVGLVVPYGFAQLCFFIERQHGLLRVIPPTTPFQLVLTKFASAFSLALFIVNIPGVLLRDLRFLFYINDGVLLMTTVCMAIAVISSQAWTSLLPLWVVFVPYIYSRGQLDCTLFWSGCHDC